MTISTTFYATSANITARDNVESGNNGKLTDALNSVKNSADNASAPSGTSVSGPFAKICDMLGLNKLMEGLTWVGNRAGDAVVKVAQLSQYAANAAQMVHDGAKVVQYGLEHGFKNLLFEVLVLFKDQFATILETWTDRVYKAGENVTFSMGVQFFLESVYNHVLKNGVQTAIAH
ncbi:hypothetical protein ABK905_25230 [Acerihabitans sp. KWT182]|uniref:Uncharacterized protein n=1 Tax=Acerihabitans sp. KWT182 TaxID=3157919 RepID=A0AAU7Q9N6_9GAMM